MSRRPIRARRSTLDGRLAELERFAAVDEPRGALVAIYDLDAHRRDPEAEEARARAAAQARGRSLRARASAAVRVVVFLPDNGRRPPKPPALPAMEAP